jgi:hypothetical protein
MRARLSAIAEGEPIPATIGPGTIVAVGRTRPWINFDPL